MKVLELYSGIGGMHFALKESGLEGEVKASVDINPVANSVYKHNFPKVLLLNRNIQCLTPSYINGLDVDTILMSPPCQPFTRNGLQLDIADARTNSFNYILSILPELNVRRILVENVKGFENSQMRDLLIRSLENCGFIYREFLLTPSQIGIPNNRLRYYCIAKKKPGDFSFATATLLHTFPNDHISDKNVKIGDVLLESTDLTSFYLQDKILLKYIKVLDICYSDSESSCCFTKAYGRYVEGTGSVYSARNREFVANVCQQLDSVKNEQYLDLARQMHLRFFTPKEISRLMCFPETFSFPDSVKLKQRYSLLGNSINVKVVAELIKLLQ